MSISKKIHFRAHYTESLSQIAAGILFKDNKLENSEELCSAFIKIAIFVHFASKCSCGEYCRNALLLLQMLQSSRLKKGKSTKVSLRNVQFSFSFFFFYKKVKLKKVKFTKRKNKKEKRNKKNKQKQKKQKVVCTHFIYRHCNIFENFLLNA